MSRVEQWMREGKEQTLHHLLLIHLMDALQKEMTRLTGQFEHREQKREWAVKYIELFTSTNSPSIKALTIK